MGKRLLILVFALLVAGLLCVPRANATGCRAYVRRAVVVEKVAVVKEVVAPVVAQFVPIPVLQYSATYAPGVPYTGPPAPAPAAAAPCANDAVMSALQRLEQRLGGLERQMGIAPPQQQAAPMPGADNGKTQAPAPQGQGGGFAAMINKSCIACHGPEVAKRDGGNFVLSPSVVLTPQQKLRIIERVRAGEMPPPNNSKSVKPPTDEEFDSALADLVKKGS
jgi:mono/diheme cytochrome c family protein